MTFVKVFGVSVGLTLVLYGALTMIGGVVGIGLCRYNCQFKESALLLLGPRAYGIYYGAGWFLMGLIFTVFILTSVSGKTKKKKKKNKKRK